MEKIIVEIDNKRFETAEKLTLVQIQYLAKAIKEVFATSIDFATEGADLLNKSLEFVFKIYEQGLATKIIAGILVPEGGKTSSQLIKYLESKVEDLDGEIQRQIIEYFFYFTIQRAKNYIPFLSERQAEVK